MDTKSVRQIIGNPESVWTMIRVMIDNAYLGCVALATVESAGSQKPWLNSFSCRTILGCFSSRTFSKETMQIGITSENTILADGIWWHQFSSWFMLTGRSITGSRTFAVAELSNLKTGRGNPISRRFRNTGLCGKREPFGEFIFFDDNRGGKSFESYGTSALFTRRWFRPNEATVAEALETNSPQRTTPKTIGLGQLYGLVGRGWIQFVDRLRGERRIPHRTMPVTIDISP